MDKAYVLSLCRQVLKPSPYISEVWKQVSTINLYVIHNKNVKLHVFRRYPTYPRMPSISISILFSACLCRKAKQSVSCWLYYTLQSI